jgi:peptide/nickel transport system ATP-binding protein
MIKAVNNVSFDVYPGETLGLVGESGCGKTTLGRTVLKLVDSTGGSVKYRGREILLNKNAGKSFRRSVQIIFQDPYASLNPRKSAGNQVSEPLIVHQIENNRKLVRERASWLLEKVGLGGEYFYRYPHELSGGQRQRIGIARALAVSPDFIVCDESVSALDVSIQAQVLNLLNDLKAEFGFTFIFISHDLAVVKHMSDRILVMKDGEIVEAGSPVSIFANPQHKYTESLIGAIPGT